MRRQVLFVQGGGQDAHQVDATLAASLAKEIGPDYEVRYPVMPYEASPDYAAWKQALTKQLASMGDGAILVGHSVGATITIMFLTESEPKQMLAGVFLIATPFVGAEGWRSEDLELPKDIGAKLPNKRSSGPAGSQLSSSEWRWRRAAQLERWASTQCRRGDGQSDTVRGGHNRIHSPLGSRSRLCTVAIQPVQCN
jgi:predicted alpha/beta hydrolase family esterase